jgi:hypothetical protein
MTLETCSVANMMDVSLRGGLEGQRSNLPAREGIAHLHRTCGAPQVQVSPPPAARKDTDSCFFILATEH